MFEKHYYLFKKNKISEFDFELSNLNDIKSFVREIYDFLTKNQIEFP